MTRNEEVANEDCSKVQAIAKWQAMTSRKHKKWRSGKRKPCEMTSNHEVANEDRAKGQVFVA